VVSMLAIGPIVRGFKPGRERYMFKGDQNRNTASFGREVSRWFHFVRCYGMLNNCTSLKTDTSSSIFAAISRQVSPTSQLGISAGNCRRALVDESGVIRTQMRTHNRSYMVAVHGTPRAIPPVTVIVTVSSHFPIPKGDEVTGEWRSCTMRIFTFCT
jgi:hypothetical protein